MSKLEIITEVLTLSTNYSDLTQMVSACKGYKILTKNGLIISIMNLSDEDKAKLLPIAQEHKCIVGLAGNEASVTAYEMSPEHLKTPIGGKVDMGIYNQVKASIVRRERAKLGVSA